MRIVKIFLRIALATSFISAVADRFGWWGSNSVWGNWQNFVDYTAQINPWFPSSTIPAIGIIVTAAEILLALALLLGFKTERAAQLSGILLLLFALAMTFSLSVKAPLDYSVFSASAAAFALSCMKEKYWELDVLIRRKGFDI